MFMMYLCTIHNSSNNGSVGMFMMYLCTIHNSSNNGLLVIAN
jgi:hypothetical protein